MPEEPRPCSDQQQMPMRKTRVRGRRLRIGPTSRPSDLVCLLFSRPNYNASSNFAQAYSAFRKFDKRSQFSSVCTTKRFRRRGVQEAQKARSFVLPDARQISKQVGSRGKETRPPKLVLRKRWNEVPQVHDGRWLESRCSVSHPFQVTRIQVELLP